MVLLDSPSGLSPPHRLSGEPLAGSAPGVIGPVQQTARRTLIDKACL